MKKIHYKILFVRFAVACTAFVFFIIVPQISLANHNVDPTIEMAPEIIVQQQLFRIEPTLNSNELERYGKGNFFQNSALRTILPIGVLVIATMSGYIIAVKRKNKACNETYCKRTFLKYIFGGAVNAFALFVVFEIIGLVINPSTLPNLAIYIDDNVTFEKGDRVQAVFDIRNSGTETAKNLVFKDFIPTDLYLDSSSLLVEKDGSLPEHLLPFITSEEILYMLGDVNPGEFIQIKYDFLITASNLEPIYNVGIVSGSNIDDVFSNQTILRRNPEKKNEKVSTFPKPGTWLVSSEKNKIVYFISSGSILREMSQENAEEIIGPGWSTDVITFPEEIINTKKIGEPIKKGEYPDSIFLTDGESRCYILDQLCRPVTESGMRDNGINERFMRTTSTRIINQFEVGELINGVIPELQENP